MRQRKAEAVLESARTLFLRNGYEGTTVDDIAEGAQVSKATVYSNFPDKAAVLAALLDRVAVESAGILAAVVAPLRTADHVESRLVETAIALARGVLRPEVLQLRRLAITESVRFPAEVAAWFARGPMSSVDLLAAAFRDLHAQGLLVTPDPEPAAAQYAYAVVAPLQDRALLTGTTPSCEEVDRFAGDAARAFWRAHRPES